MQLVAWAVAWVERQTFQSPNPRGMDCNDQHGARRVQLLAAFSPLILGEWIATSPDRRPRGRSGTSFSPLILGEWIATHRDRLRGATPYRFQSPNPRGMDCNWNDSRDRLHARAPTFSPLILGEWIATRSRRRVRIQPWVAFSPLILGEWIATPVHGSAPISS